ncbi:hypothetical protein STVA_05010 [Allostella vacuolata]|nr:hypothetical protein STVA_05010 [Stella vacuolata]
MGFWDRWLSGIRAGGNGERISTPAALREFLSGQASFIAQKVVTEYCQAKAGRHWTHLSMEKTFIDQLARSRWEAFSLVLADLFVLTAARLRPMSEAPDQPEREAAAAVAGALVGLYREALDAYPLPPHRPEGWADRVQELDARLRAAGAAPPGSAREIAEVGGRAVFAILPIHLNMRRLDLPMVMNGIAFQTVAVAGRIRRRLDLPALAAALGTGGRQGGPG